MLSKISKYQKMHNHKMPMISAAMDITEVKPLKAMTDNSRYYL